MAEGNGDVTHIKDRKIPAWAIWAAVLVIVFLLGFVPMWLQYKSAAQANEAAQQQLRKADIKNQLLTAIVESKNGEYEIARQNASDFYTNLNAEIEKGEAGSLTEDQRAKLKPIFANRDDMITLLAQRDPAAVERLTDVYAVYRQAFGQTPKTAVVPEP